MCQDTVRSDRRESWNKKMPKTNDNNSFQIAFEK